MTQTRGIFPALSDSTRKHLKEQLMPRKKSKRSKPKGSEKVAKVMHEFKKGTLKSSSGQVVTNRNQALAIGYSEQRRKERPKSLSDARKRARRGTRG